MGRDTEPDTGRNIGESERTHDTPEIGDDFSG
jgi:hypothetical protein